MVEQYKEGAVAEDGRGNFLVYRSGQWFPSQSDGRPLERIPRPDFGANHYQLPNGDIVRQGPRGGQETVENFGGAGGGAGGGALVGADARGRYNIGADSLAASARAAATEEAKGGNPLNRDWGAVLLNSVDLDPRGDSSFRPFAPVARIVGGQDFQNYDQALATYEASLLPIQSGASVTESEARRQIRADFPQLGDSEETVRRKSANRLRRINAVFQGIGREPPFSAEQIANPTSVAMDDELQALAAVQGQGGRNDQGGGPLSGGQPPRPGSSPETAIDIESGISPDEILALLQNGGWVRRGSGEPFEAVASRGAPQEGAENLRPGLNLNPTPEEVVEERRDANGLLRRVDAGVRGAADTLTFGFADELAAGANTVIPLDPGARSGFQDGFGQAYRNNLNIQRAVDRADAKDVPFTRGAGQLAGALVPAAGALSAARAPVAASRLSRAARGAGTGAAFGGAYGLGSAEGSVAERAPNALVGAGVGGGIGAASVPVAGALSRFAVEPTVNAIQGANRFVGRQVGRAASALGVPGAEALVERATPNALQTGVNRMASRSPQNVNALSANAERFRAEEIDPTFADVINDGGRGTLRALATRQTPARQAAREFADNRAVGLQDRVSRQARRTISDDPRSPMEIRDQAAQEARQAAAPLYKEAYAQPIELTDDLRSLLQTPAGQAAAQRAARIAANERRAIDLDAPDMQTLDYIKRGLDDVLEGYRDKTTGKMVLDTEGRAVQDVLSNFRSELDRINPAYAKARSAFADSAKLQDAAALGEKFMSMEADQFAAAVNRLSPEERQIARAAARRAVERQAGTQGQAPGVAQRLAGGREQGMRSEALLDDAAPMQRAMRTELEALRNAQAVSPAQGSQTSMNLQDAGNAAGMMLGAIRRPISTAVEAVGSRIRSRGFSDQEAQAIVEAAIDPAQTTKLIEMLSERMSRREARNLARAIRYQVTIGLQSGQQN